MIKVINNDLKAKLGEELYAQVEEALKDSNVVIETQENFIPKHRFDEANESIKAAKAEAQAAKEEAEAAKAEVEAAKADIAKYADYDELKAKAESISDYDDMKSKYEETLSSNKKLKLQSLGFDKDFVDYALTKIEGDDFEAAAVEFLNANPKMKAENFSSVNSSLNLNGEGPIDMTKITDPEKYIQARKTHNVDGTPIAKK